jgi:hypothetical protein
LWYPGHAHDIVFNGANPRIDPKNPTVPWTRIFLRLFDHFGMALAAEYELELSSLSLKLIKEISERNPSQLNP